jgi:hypothetical protein
MTSTLVETPLIVPAVAEVATANPVARLIDPVEEKIVMHYPNLFPAVKACLAVFGAMALKDRTKPLSLMFEAGSGKGKTAVLQMTFPMDPDAQSLVYRSDKFTPKAFVTHAANVAEEKLPKMDLLPKLKDKVLVTKELAAIFRGREDELKENFAMLISVLDGKGFTSDTGMRGQRGYQEAIIFNWIGATTPLPLRTHRMMSQLGTRLLFFEIPAIQPTLEELLAFAESDTSAEAERACQRAVNEFLVALMARHPVGSLDPNDVPISRDLLRQIVEWARFLVAGRAEVNYEKGGESIDDFGQSVPVSAKSPEGPHKVINYFKDLARGHALIHDRAEVTQDDVDLIAEVAISSIPANLRPIIRMLRQTDTVDSSTCARICGVSRPTARHYLLELAVLDICQLTKGIPYQNAADSVRLREAYRWLRQDPESQV